MHLICQLCSWLQLLIGRIQMNTDTNDRGKERIVFFPVDHEAVQTIVVE